jgi:hypothetical protein
MRKTLIVAVLATALATAGLGTWSPATAGTGSSMLSNPDFDDVATGRSDVKRCAPMTDRSFVGTVTGADGLFPNVTVGFDVKDKKGRNIDIADGCAKYGYSAIVQLNHYIGFEGAPAGTEQFNKGTKYIPVTSKGLVTNRFELRNLPANADNVWIESYTRSYTGSPCGLTCAGEVDNRKYGNFNRRAVKLSKGSIDLVLPMTPEYGGVTGKIRLKVVSKSGRPVALKKIYAWSMLKKDGSQQFQGWGMGGHLGNGVWEVPALAPGQKYVLWLYAPNGSVIARKKWVPVKTGSTTKITVKI